MSSGVFSADDSLVLTAGWDDKSARIWDASNGKTMVIFEGHSFYVEGARFSSDETRVLTWSWDGSARIWRVPRDRRTAAEWVTTALHSRYTLHDGVLVRRLEPPTR